MPLRIFLAASLSLLAVACDQTISCPSGASAVGTVGVTFSPTDAGDNCVVTRSADGGPTDAGLVATPAATQVTFCAQSDGGSQFYVMLQGGSPLPVTLDGGSFSTTSTASNVTGSNCICALNIAQNLSGQVHTADGGLPALQSDGGLSSVTSFSGAFDELFTAAGSGADCACNVPCGAHYLLTQQ